MKKVLKVIGAIFLVLGVIALVVCMCVMPNETREFFNVVFEYLDKPIVLCGVSITLGGILLYFVARYILTNTSVGKKKLQAVDNKIEDEKLKNAKLSEEKDKAIKKLEEEIDNVKNENKVYFGKLEGAIKKVPNKKVQEALNNGEEKDNQTTSK